PDLLDAWRASAVGGDELSQRTLQTIRRLALERDFRRQPLQTYTKLQFAAVSQPDPDLLFALAEISYSLGREAEKREPAHACAYYYLCAGYAYHYLFPPGGSPEAPELGLPGTFIRPVHCGQGTFDSFAYDPRFRLACDLYNTGL